eukprot:TRINITY_DN106408_c0_g1_i1.p1 TRINITY_DN106408_c0_g1~~TRINITY_DN106408_c0_g1_i1.p1  ORF type:complete len:196 (+),score=16.77 TRINITY_DN106408_c0_g1_i1:84-671(+)
MSEGQLLTSSPAAVRVDARVTTGFPYFSTKMTKPRVVSQEELDQSNIPSTAERVNEALDAVFAAYHDGLSAGSKIVPGVVLIVTTLFLAAWLLCSQYVYDGDALGNPSIAIVVVGNPIVLILSRAAGLQHKAAAFGHVDRTIGELNTRLAPVQLSRGMAASGIEYPFQELLPEACLAMGPRTGSVDIIEISAVAR